MVGRYVEGEETTGYSILDGDGVTLKVTVDDFNELVKAGKVGGFKFIVFEGEGYIVPVGTLTSQIRTLNTPIFDIIDRLYDDGGNVIGYEVLDEGGKKLTLSKGKVWELAFGGLVSNADALYSESEGSIRKIITTDIDREQSL